MNYFLGPMLKIGRYTVQKNYGTRVERKQGFLINGLFNKKWFIYLISSKFI